MPRASSSKKPSAGSKQPAAPKRVPYAPHPPPPREPFSLPGTASLPLGPSSQPGYCLTTGLFFLSDAWIPPLRADVDALLAAFEQGYPAERDAGMASPCELVKRLWVEMGWKWVHLLGVPQNGAMRGPWGDSIVRAFLEHLNPSEPPLRQTAALLAIYLFVTTQPASMQTIFVKVDPDMLEYILALPAQLAPVLDPVAPPAPLDTAAAGPSTPAPLSPPASADLPTVLHALLSRSSFHIVPRETFLHPPSLPHVRVVPDPRRARRQAQRALALLGAVEEVGELARGEVRPAAARGKRRREEDDSEEEDEPSDVRRRDEAERVLNAEELARLGSATHAAKRAAVAPDRAGQPSTLVQPVYDLQAQVLAEAKAKTRAAMQDVAAQGLLGDQIGADEGQDLLALLEEGGGAAVDEFAATMRGLLELGKAK